MTNAQRAKQFASGFDPLSGFQEMLREAETVYIPKGELAEDKKEQLNYTLSSLHPGQMVTVIYYKEKGYVKVTGMVAKIDTHQKILTIVDKPIPILDIYDIEIE